MNRGRPEFRDRAKLGRFEDHAPENGIEILVLDAPDPAYGVDTPEDLERVRQMMSSGD